MKSINNNSCFSINLLAFTDKLVIKKSTDLVNKWLTIPKTKQKLYIKLYHKLLKAQTLKNHIKKSNNINWVCDEKKNTKSLYLLNYSSLYNFSKSHNFLGQHLKGYTRHGEKVYNKQNKSKIKNLYTKYNQLKKYYLI